jgi:pantoate--beta-alanine ligase
MEIVTTIAEVRERVRRWHRAGLRVAFVPTMGNLHAGHRSLIELARQHGDRFVASIFVNPMQFGPNEDFAHYPRTPREDERMLAEAGCDLMFMPDSAEIYPRGLGRSTRVEVPELSGVLDGKFRPGHFEGVSTVVAKLFNIVEPSVAVFGEKDYQQLTIIRRMVEDLCMPVAIVPAATVRESDGLALSSRNQYLSVVERQIAPRLYQELSRVAERLKAGETDIAGLERRASESLAAAGLRPDYFCVRARDLAAPGEGTRELVILAAVRLGRARLIDNIQFTR